VAALVNLLQVGQGQAVALVVVVVEAMLEVQVTRQAQRRRKVAVAALDQLITQPIQTLVVEAGHLL
jgi:DUF1365 family protein